MRSILVCTDGSPYANVALRYARDWAERLSLRVKVLFVEDLRLTRGPLVTGYYGPVGMAPGVAYPAFYDELIKAIKQHGQHAVDVAHAVFDGFPGQVDYAVREGLVHDCILQEAKTVDLVCLGGRGEHGQWSGDDVGSTVQKVIRHSERPVLVTPAEFRTLAGMLVAYDGSKSANRALREACPLASDVGLAMTVVTVAPKGPHRSACEAALEEARQLVSAYEDVSADFVLLDGDDIEAVVIAHAAEKECDLIVMGAYGRSRIREWLVGSTTTGVLVRATLPVLLVR